MIITIIISIISTIISIKMEITNSLNKLNITTYFIDSKQSHRII